MMELCEVLCVPHIRGKAIKEMERDFGFARPPKTLHMEYCDHTMPPRLPKMAPSEDGSLPEWLPNIYIRMQP